MIPDEEARDLAKMISRNPKGWTRPEAILSHAFLVLIEENERLNRYLGELVNAATLFTPAPADQKDPPRRPIDWASVSDDEIREVNDYYTGRDEDPDVPQ